MLIFHSNKVLFDVSKRLYHDIVEQMADQKWVEQEIIPLFKDIKNLRFAYVVTQASYETMYTNQMHGLMLDRPEFKEQIEVGVFLELAEAQDWLQTG